jgi:hypothetical protein
MDILKLLKKEESKLAGRLTNLRAAIDALAGKALVGSAGGSCRRHTVWPSNAELQRLRPRKRENNPAKP